MLAATRVELGRAAACACALSLAGAPAPAAARPLMTQAAPPGQRLPLYFRIPSLALADALDRYAVVADETVLFSDDLVTQRRSHPVDGHYTPREALELLLTGTGLRAEQVRQGEEVSFVLRAATGDGPAPSTRTPPAMLDRSYDGLVQRRVWEALCSNRQTAPGFYRVVMLLTVGAAGQLLAPQLLGSTGDAARDRAIVATLHGLRLDAAPPPSLKQPLALVILPATAEGPRPCASAEGQDD